VLEARDRVGGRIWTEHLAAGIDVDRGGAWLAPGHDAMFRLADETGVSTYKTWVRGAHLLVSDGRQRKYKGLIPKIGPLAVGSIAAAQLRLDLLGARIPVDAPWTAKRAEEWDARTVADWLAGSGIRSKAGRDLFEMAVRGLFAADLNEVSLLDLLFLVRAHKNTKTLFSIEGGAQENLVEGGAGGIASRLAADLGDALHLSSPVRSIRQSSDRVAVTSDRVEVRASRAIVAVPPVLAAEIGFEPALGDDRTTLYRRAAAGWETKTVVVYDEPFWRSEGYSGQSAEPGGPSEVTIDASPSSGEAGVLASFTFGEVARVLGSLPSDERRRLLLRALTDRFGPKASEPVDVVETAWWSEPWSRGCSMSHFGPGLLTRCGPLLRQPFGRIHWAGTETATKSHGSMDGAARSGERAAQEVLDNRAESPT